MDVFDNLETVKEYISSHKNDGIEYGGQQFHYIMKYIKNFKPINSDTKLLEIGTGLGWFFLYCNLQGIYCEGLEISPQLINYAKKKARLYNIEINVLLGNIEDYDIGIEKYDIIIANSVFEHVKLWEEGILKVYNALKINGLFYFVSTNKFNYKSGEFNFPFYGWLPNKIRYKLRKWFQGDDIMKLGIDYNQFTYLKLKCYFKKVGFSKVMNIWEFIKLNDFMNSGIFKKAVIRTAKKSILVRLLFQFLIRTFFICIK